MATPLRFLSSLDFDSHAYDWQKNLSTWSDEELRREFGFGGEFKVKDETYSYTVYKAYASFDLQTILALISTPCVSQIIASFVYLPESGDEPLFKLDEGNKLVSMPLSSTIGGFQVVLSASDQTGNRISPYYRGNVVWVLKWHKKNEGAKSPVDVTHHQDLFHKVSQKAIEINFQEHLKKNPDTQFSFSDEEVDVALFEGTGMRVPYNLVQCWVRDWRLLNHENKVNKELFSTIYGPLKAYAFALSDFVSPLFNMKPESMGKFNLNLFFGIKSYLPADVVNSDETSFDNVLGLIVRLSPVKESTDKQNNRLDSDQPALNQKNGNDNSGNPDSGGPAYDVSTPMPPGY